MRYISVPYIKLYLAIYLGKFPVTEMDEGRTVSSDNS